MTTKPVTITKEQIGTRILAVGFDKVGTVSVPKVKVFAKAFTGEYVVVTRAGLRKYLGAQQAACYGKKGQDYFVAKTIAQLNKIVNQQIALA